ncbi:MAG: hypothetical protein WA160_10175 [Pseudobdellovibrio sp.]
MKKLILIIVSFIAFTVNAEELDLVKIQNVIQANSAFDTEQKVANVLIAFSDLMGYLSTEITAPTSQEIKALLPQIQQAFDDAQGTSNYELISVINDLKTGVVTYVQALNGNNASIQAIAPKIVSLQKGREKYPNAAFVPTLDLLIKLTQEFAGNHANFTNDVNAYASKMDEVQALMASGSSKTSKKMDDLKQAGHSLEKYSFAEIGARYKSISTVLRMSYQE